MRLMPNGFGSTAIGAARRGMPLGLSPKAIILLLMGIGAVAGGYFFYTTKLAPQAAAATTQPATVGKGDVRLSITGTGSITPPRAADLSFRSSGVVKNVYVQVGDEVKEGQPLAQLDTRTLELQVKQAQIALRTAQLNLQTLTENARPEDLASAQASLDNARQKMVTMEGQGKSEDVAASEASYKSAQAKLDQLMNPTAADLATAQAAVETAKSNVGTAQAKLDQLRNPTAADISAADSAVITARSKLDQLRNPTPADIASAQASVETARNTLATAKTNLDKLKTPTQEQVLAAQQAIANAQNSLETAQGNLNKLQSTITDEKRRLLIQAYQDLIIAREQLASTRAANAPEDQLAKAEAAVSLALRRVDALEAETNFPDAGTTAQQINGAQLAMTSARLALDQAKLKYQNLITPLPEDVLSAERSVTSGEAGVKSAEAKLQQLLQPSPTDLAAAESSVTSAQAKLDQLKNPTASDIAAAQSAVQSAQANVQTAQAKVDTLRSPAASDIAAAQASVLQAQNQLEKTRVPYQDTDLASQRASVLSAEAQLAKITTPSTALDIAKAQLSVDKAQLEADSTQSDFEQALLVAPFSGIISKVSVTPGVSQGVGASTAVVSIVDPTVMQVDVNIDETDVAKLSLNQAAAVAVDAAGQRPYRGKIVAIAPTATVQSGVTSYKVTISIPEPRGLRAGMTAVATVVYQEATGVVIAPSRAVRTQGRDRVVQVLVNGVAENRKVTVGIDDGTNVEIKEGLQEGDQVLVNTARTGTGTGQGQQRIAIPGGGIPGGFGGGGLGGR